MNKFIINTNVIIPASELAQITELFELGIRPIAGDVIHTHTTSYVVSCLVFDLPKNTIFVQMQD